MGPTPLLSEAARCRIRKWHLEGKMVFVLEGELFLNAKISLGNGNFSSSLFSFFLCQTYFHWLISLPPSSPWGKPPSINHVRFAVGNTFFREQVNVLWGVKAEYRKAYLQIQKKLVPLHPHQPSHEANWQETIFSTFNKAVFTFWRLWENVSYK